GRLVLCRREPLAILEGRSGNRPQESERKILTQIPRDGEAGPRNRPRIQGSTARGNGSALEHRQKEGREAACTGIERSANEAMSEGILVRKCRGLDEFHRCVDLQREIWGEADLEVEPATMFVVAAHTGGQVLGAFDGDRLVGYTLAVVGLERDRKSTRLNSSHGSISYAVFCLKKKNTKVQVKDQNVHNQSVC